MRRVIQAIPHFDRLKQRTNYLRWIIPIQAFLRQFVESRPLNAGFSWSEYGFDDNTFEFINLLSRNSTAPGNQFAAAGSFITPPQCYLFQVEADTGKPRYVYWPATQLLLCRVISNTGGINTTYTVRSVDSVIEKTTSNVIDRWPTINYTARPANSLCLLIIPSPNSTDLGLLAFERPVITACPAGASAPGASPARRAWFGV